MFQKNKRDRKRYQIARNELRKRTRNEYWIKIRQTINSRSAPVSPTIFIHKSPPPASEETLFFSLSRGISRGKGRVESDSRKRNSLYESNARVHTILFPFHPSFFSFHRSIDNPADRLDGQTFARDPSGPVSNRFQKPPSLSVLRLEGRRGRRGNRRGKAVAGNVQIDSLCSHLSAFL